MRAASNTAKTTGLKIAQEASTEKNTEATGPPSQQKSFLLHKTLARVFLIPVQREQGVQQNC